MERRKLIKQGKGGYTIYMPKKWIDKKGLKEGDEIIFEERNNSLVINSDNKTKKEITIEINENNLKELKHILTHIYRKGYDIIILKGNTEKFYKKTKEISFSILLGLEITEKTDSTIIIENLSEPTEQKFDVMMRRLFFTIKETIALIKNDYESENFTNIEEIEDLRNQSDKFNLFCKRILVKEKDNKNPITSWELLTFLMHIQHSLYYLYKYLNQKKISKKKNICELIKTTDEIFDLLYKAYYKKDIEIIHRIFEYREKIVFGTCINELEKSSGNDTVILSSLKESIRLIQVALSPILSQLFEQNMGLE